MGHSEALDKWRQLGEHSAGPEVSCSVREMLHLADPLHLEGRREVWLTHLSEWVGCGEGGGECR